MGFWDRRELAAVFAGGVAGALLRTWLTQALPDASGSWPWTVLAINLAGAFVLGAVVGLLRGRSARDLGAPRELRPLVGTGFCGALTTFSTFQLELLELVRHGRPGLAIAYAAVSIVGGYVAVVAAIAVGRSLAGAGPEAGAAARRGRGSGAGLDGDSGSGSDPGFDEELRR